MRGFAPLRDLLQLAHLVLDGVGCPAWKERLNMSSGFGGRHASGMLTIVQVCRNSVDVNLGLPGFDESY